MTRKNRLLAIIAMILSSLALGETEVNPQSLATVQATVDFCAQITPSDAAMYQERAAMMMSGMSSEELSILRKSDSFREAYTSVTAALGKIDSLDAQAACERFLTVDNDEIPDTK